MLPCLDLNICAHDEGKQPQHRCFSKSVQLWLQGAAAATGVALINSIANIGGMIGPYLIGKMSCPVLI